MVSNIGKSFSVMYTIQMLTSDFRLTSDIYPGDLGWSVNWDKPEERQEWYHNMSSVMQAGPCVRSNQLDYDEDVLFKVRNEPTIHVYNGEKLVMLENLILTPFAVYAMDRGLCTLRSKDASTICNDRLHDTSS